MKKFLFLGIGSALMFTMGGVGPAQADGGPHIGNAQTALAPGIVIAQVGADRCAACHRAHTAKAGFLLIQAQPALCYSCHGTGGTGSDTDIKNGISAGVAGSALRGGGFDQAVIGSGQAKKDMGTQQSYGISSVNQTIPVLTGGVPVATTSRHNITGTAGTAWGNGPTNGNIAGGDTATGKSLTLQCGSCHDPHGNKNYRILRPMPVDSQWVTTPAVTAIAIGDVLPGGAIAVAADVRSAVAAILSPATNVLIPDATAKGYTTTNYWATGDITVPLTLTPFTANHGVPAAGTAGAPDGYIQNISAWCTTCHTRYLATTGSYKTASGDATFMYKHRSDGNSAQGAANCIQCHVSHGSNASVAGVNSSSVLNPDGSAAAAGDSRLLRVDNRGTCLMCHNV